MNLQRIKKFLYPALLAIITVFVHATYLNNGFTWLDHIDLEDKQAIVPLSTAPALFTRTYSQTTFYRPVISLFHSLDYAIYGNWAPGYHLTNLLIHCAVVVVCFYCIRELRIATEKAAFIGSLLVAVHPANVYSIGLISYRTDPLAVLSMLGALLAAILFIRTVRKKYLALCALLFFVGILAKESVLFWFPVILVLLYFYYQKDPRKYHQLGTTILCTAGLYMVLRQIVIGKFWVYQGENLSFDKALGTRLEAFSKLLLNFFSPVVPTINDSIAVTTPTFHSSIITLLAILSIVGGIYYYRKNRAVVLVIGTVIISIIPALNIVALPRFISPHYLYFTTVAAAMALGYILSNIHSQHWKNTLYGILAIWGTVAAYNSFAFGNRFSNDLALFLPEVTRHPHYLEGAYYVGRYYYNQKKYTKSEEYLRRSIATNHNYLAYLDKATAMNNLAIVLVQNNKLSEAEKYFEEVVRLGSGDRSRAVYNLALTKLTLNKSPEAISLLEKNILESKGGSVEMYVLLAKAYVANGEKDKAGTLLHEVRPLAKTDSEIKVWEETAKLLP